MDILQKIIAHKFKEVLAAQEKTPLKELEKSPLFSRRAISLKERLLQPSSRPHIIAEFKKRSPSKGIINDLAKAEEVAKGYEKAGAVAVSILTDKDFFGGNNEDLQQARQVVNLPLLRKEFIISQYQVIEAKAIGADVVLLIAAALPVQQVRQLALLAKSVGLETLLEVHHPTELETYYTPEIDMVGVNNRDLKTFKVSLEISERLISLMPKNVPSVSESGLSRIEELYYLQQLGFKGFLIGENFMKHPDPPAALMNFLNSYHD
ncbi:MAG: indole-3-glycerol phosphate synthase TrpC [Cytophagales bacterium]|nr:indole-3-glycerol phosphate synthase TrpC [Bernardetiaceae bacterium]MDW8211640.1 indole-3-glycerol phosphate synthase TrpC [Cytophagales bacterium]